MPRFRREDLPACALFLLLYALGVSCGLASYGGVYRSQVLPALAAVFASGAWRAALVRALLCCGAGALMQAAFVLLTGLSVWLLPLWAGAVLVRALSVGLCAGLCMDALRTGIPHAPMLVLILALEFAAVYFSEVRLGMLPLVRRTDPDVEDALYLTVGLRLALRYLLLSLAVTAAAVFTLHLVLAS